VQVKISADKEVQLSEIQVDSLFHSNPELEILNSSSWDTIQAEHAFYLNQSHTCIVYDTGYYEFGPIAMEYIYEGEKSQQNSDSAGVYAVFQSKFEADQAAPIRDIVRVEAPSYWWIWILGGVLLMGLLFWWYRRRTKREPISEPIESTPVKVQKLPEEIALIALDSLSEQTGQDDFFYTQISMIVRRYLKDRFDIPAMEMLTAEILSSLSKAILKRSKPDLEFLLNSADYARFGQGKSIEEYKRFILAKAVLFVETMKKELGI
jgi:hypothetical protein